MGILKYFKEERVINGWKWKRFAAFAVVILAVTATMWFDFVFIKVMNGLNQMVHDLAYEFNNGSKSVIYKWMDRKGYTAAGLRFLNIGISIVWGAFLLGNAIYAYRISYAILYMFHFHNRRKRRYGKGMWGWLVFAVFVNLLVGFLLLCVPFLLQ